MKRILWAVLLIIFVSSCTPGQHGQPSAPPTPSGAPPPPPPHP